ncbi:MAG: co-chaperone GroES [bacterium]|nr:co-chaperone GroES [bacterium]
MLRPLLDNILLKQEKKEEKMLNGLYVPGTAAEPRYLQGTVLAVGPGKNINGVFETVSVRPGDVVLYDSKYVSEMNECHEDGTKLLMCSEGCLLAVVE